MNDHWVDQVSEDTQKTARKDWTQIQQGHLQEDREDFVIKLPILAEMLMNA